MVSRFASRHIGLAASALIAAGLGGCGSFDAKFGAAGTHFVSATDERECLMRAMYFESNRSSEEGMLAVGTVVMNRVQDAKYPKSICGVVGQPKQFAPGVLTSPMTSRATTRIASVADRVLAGERNDKVGAALHFHTAGYTYPYRNMHYVAVAGGNAFYEKKANPTQSQIMVASLADREEQSLLPASLRGRAMQAASRRDNAIVTASLSTPISASLPARRDEDEAPTRIVAPRAPVERAIVERPVAERVVVARAPVERPAAERPAVERAANVASTPARAKPSIVVASAPTMRPAPKLAAVKPEPKADAKAQAKVVLAALTPSRPATTRTGQGKVETTKTGAAPALPPSRATVALLGKSVAPPEPPKRVKLTSLRRPVADDED